MYASGAQGTFDALGHHPYCFDGPTYNCPVIGGITDAWSEMTGSAPSLRSTMIANGDGGKQIWATEFVAPTAVSPKAVSLQLQAQMLTRAYALFAEQSWAGPLFAYTCKDRGTNPGDIEDWFGLVTATEARKPAYDAYQASALSYRVTTTAGTHYPGDINSTDPDHNDQSGRYGASVAGNNAFEEFIATWHADALLPGRQTRTRPASTGSKK